MKRIYDGEELEKSGMEAKLESIFDTPNLQYVAYQYEKGEFLSHPFGEEELQIIVKGTISIYYIREDGSKYSLAHSEGIYLLGDVEFFVSTPEPFYAEALSETTSIAISLKQYRNVLKQDKKFLYFLSETLAKKLLLAATDGVVNMPLEERVWNHMKYHCEKGILAGVEQTAFRLHCSARQLQRVLNQLEMRAIVQKCGKGRYRLVIEESSSRLLRKNRTNIYTKEDE